MTRESSHETVFVLLPWYANQTLTTDECSLVEQHLTRCANCTQELQHLYDIGAAMKVADQTAPSVSSALDRTFQSIDAWENRRQQGFWRRVLAWFQTFWSPSVPMARLVFATQLAIILVFAGILVMPRMSNKAYTTLSGGGALGAGGPRLNILFEPQTTEGAMRQVLLESNVTIISGPSALGVYVVELSGRKDNDPAVDMEIERLRAKTGVVRFVERQP